MAASNPTILIADDHPLFRAALVQAVQAACPAAQLLQACDVPELQALAAANPQADLVLLDLHMPGAHGFSALSFLLGNFPALPVIVVSANTHPVTVRRALDYGAAGFISKSASTSEIWESIATVLAGGELVPPAGVKSAAAPDPALDVSAAVASLTPKQYRVLTMLVEGLLNKQIAWELDVTEATVKAHMTEIFRKLNVRSRTQAVLALKALALDADETQALD